MVQVHLLGAVRLLTDDHRQVTVDRSHLRCLLAILAMNVGLPVAIDALVERVWDERPPADVRATLHSHISRLRAALAEADSLAQRRSGRDLLRYGDGGYTLRLPREAVDVHQARALAERARTVDTGAPDGRMRAAEMLARSRTQWEGTPLSGLKGSWADRTRHQLDREGLTILGEWADLELGQGRHRTMVGPLFEALTVHPTDEAIAGWLMLALYRSNRQADALEVYRRTRHQLVDELGIEPGPALQRLHQQVQIQAVGATDRFPTGEPDVDDASSTAPVERSPMPSTGLGDRMPVCTLLPVVEEFVDRAEEIERLGRLLVPERTDGVVPVVVISGPPGVGKTTLAMKSAHRLVKAFPDGQLFIGLGGIGTPRRPEDVLADLLRVCGMPEPAMPRGLGQRAAELRGRLADRRVLLVLDDAADARQVRPLLPGTSGCAVLITSRRQLPTIAGPDAAIGLAPLSTTAAGDLLTQLIGADRATREPGPLADVGSACGHLPLALRIAGARLAAHPEWTIERFAARLHDRRVRLDQLAIDDLSVRPGLELSYQALDPELRATVRRIGLLGTRTFATWAVRALTGTDDGDVPVEGLVAANLIQVAGADPVAQPRYRMHDLVAAYASELAERDDPSSTGAADERLMKGMLKLTDGLRQILPCGADDLPARDLRIEWTTSDAIWAPTDADVLMVSRDPAGWLAAEQHLMVWAIERSCRSGGYATAAQLAERVLEYVEPSLGFDETDRVYSLVRDAARAGGDELIAWRTECRRCLHLARATRVSEAAHGLLACAAGFERANALPELAHALAEAATYHLLEGRSAEAVDLCGRAFATARECGSRVTEYAVTREWAGVLAASGEYPQALVMFERSLEVAAELGSGPYRVMTLMRLSASAFDNGDLERSAEACREAELLIDETRNPGGMAWLRNRSALLASARGRHSEAIELGTTAVNTFARLGDLRGLARARATLADARARMRTARSVRSVVSPRQAG